MVRPRPEATTKTTAPRTVPTAPASPMRAPATTARTYRVQEPAARPAAPPAEAPAPPARAPAAEELGPEVLQGPPVPEGYVVDLDGGPPGEPYYDEGYDAAGYGAPGPGGYGHACETCGGVGCANCWFGGAGFAGGLYVRAEYLRWQTSGMYVPALVTTSVAVPGQTFPPPVRNAGVLGVNGTVILYGDNDILNETRSGGRIIFGLPLDYDQRLRIEAEYLGLDEAQSTYSATSSGNPILARPFFNLATQPNNIAQESSELVAYPNVIRGTVGVDANSQFEGAAVRLKYLMCCTEGCVPSLVRRRGDVPGGYKVELTGGYRYLRLDDNLSINEDLATIPGPGTFNLTDSFSTQNEFHGLEIGMLLQTRRGRWSMDWTSRVAIGNTNGTSTIFGQTIIDNGQQATTYQGGLLAQTSNIGTYSASDFAVVPELGVNLGFDLSPRFRVLVGYSLIYWSRVLRAGDQIDREVNPNLIPPANQPITGALRPEQAFVWTDFWAQGFSVGLEGAW
ncbi:MAG: BBP7 family outer membrane beta-barrel protein [Pirellulales bacterium]